ncbi:MAG: sulfotransferase family protein [Prochloraceae cyanobacterium]
MTIEVIGAGLGRTGTLSLKAGLEQLGFNKCYHMKELIDRPENVSFWEKASQGKSINWDEIFKDYKATVDYPGCSYYIQLMERYPDAKVILTVRDPEKWYESVFNTIYQLSLKIKQKSQNTETEISLHKQNLIRLFNVVVEQVFQKDFQGKFRYKQYAIEVFNQHIAEVKQKVPAEKLLVYQVKEGWQPLCKFLDRPIPDNEFPHLNDRGEFKERLAQMFA